MPNIQFYIDKLEALKDYMWYFICWQQCERDKLEVYYKTGISLSNAEEFQTFDKWLEYRGWEYNLY